MRNHRLLAGATLLLASIVSAQNSTLPRGEDAPIGLNGDTFANFSVASPKGLTLENGAKPSSRRVVYQAWESNQDVNFRRSVDGGRTWGPTQVITTVTGNFITNLQCVAYGDRVYITYEEENPTANNWETPYVLGSDDQGENWQGPLNLTPNQNTGPGTVADVDDVFPVATPFGVQIVFEFETVGNGADNAAYTRASFIGGAFQITIPWQTPHTWAPDSGPDIDANVRIDADDNLVVVSWCDDSFSSNDIWSITSADGGVNFSAPFNHTGGTASSLNTQSDCAVDNGMAYVFYEVTGNNFDQVFFDRGVVAANGTTNFTDIGIACSVAPNDTDFNYDTGNCTVDDGILICIYREDRSGSNQHYMVVDNTGGDDLVNGIINERFLSPNDNNFMTRPKICGNMIALVWEELPGGGGEEASILLSHDRGNTFDQQVFTTLGYLGSDTADVDEVQVALTQNDDYVVAFQDDRAVAGVNELFTTGGKYPFLVDATQSIGALFMRRTNPAEAGNSFALVLASLSTGGILPAQGGMPNDYGYFVALDADPLYFGSIAGLADTINFIDPAGNTSWFDFPQGSGQPIPPISSVLGMDIFVVGATVDLAKTQIWQSFTDPVILGN